MACDRRGAREWPRPEVLSPQFSTTTAQLAQNPLAIQFMKGLRLLHYGEDGTRPASLPRALRLEDQGLLPGQDSPSLDDMPLGHCQVPLDEFDIHWMPRHPTGGS
jgi:hypothetical protein